ncbi:MAG: hypothetical protein H0X38_12695, partial [Planctomycetes bacterium]|nr:hypothetical protein [Planctomycetota bacterium]
MAIADVDAASAQVQRELARTLPAELAEVLLPVLRWRGAGGRLIAVLPNPT